jgi:hypothetical protein
MIESHIEAEMTDKLFQRAEKRGADSRKELGMDNSDEVLNPVNCGAYSK